MAVSINAAELAVYEGCMVDGPLTLAPPQLTKIHLGMTTRELQNVLGEPDYSPSEGLFYFSTGGDCPLGDENRVATCGVVAGFRALNGSDIQTTDTLQSYFWGAIGE